MADRTAPGQGRHDGRGPLPRDVLSASAFRPPDCRRARRRRRRYGIHLDNRDRSWLDIPFCAGVIMASQKPVKPVNPHHLTAKQLTADRSNLAKARAAAHVRPRTSKQKAATRARPCPAGSTASTTRPDTMQCWRTRPAWSAGAACFTGRVRRAKPGTWSGGSMSEARDRLNQYLTRIGLSKPADAAQQLQV